MILALVARPDVTLCGPELHNMLRRHGRHSTVPTGQATAAVILADPDMWFHVIVAAFLALSRDPTSVHVTLALDT